MILQGVIIFKNRQEVNPMPLDKAYFDGIKPESIRGKFYRKTEIDALLKEIAARAELQNSENELLSMKLARAQAALQEQTDGMNGVAQGIISDANEEAGRILAEARAAAEAEAGELLAEAREKSRGIIEATMRQQEFAAEKIEQSYSAMREQHEECISSIKAAWQEFLCGLDTDDEQPAQDEAPPDLSEKVASLAQALKDI